MLIRLILCIGLMVSVARPAAAASPPEAMGYASLVMTLEAGRVLHAHNADAPRQPDGLIKLLSVYAALLQERSGEVGLADRIRISPAAAARSAERDAHPLTPGARHRFGALLRHMLAEDADGSAMAVAERIAGAGRGFRTPMNVAARELGLSVQRFSNAARAESHRTTARDLAHMLQALVLAFPEQKAIWAGAAARLDSTPRLPAGTRGGMAVSGPSTAHAALLVTRNGRSVVTVVLGAPTPADRDAHLQELLRRAFISWKAPDPAAQASPQALLRAPGGVPSVRAPVLRAAMAASPGALFADDEARRDGIRIVIEGEDDASAARPTPPPRDDAEAATPARRPDPSPDAAGDTDAIVSYAVQVGAYAQRAAADARLAETLRRWPTYFLSALPRTTPAPAPLGASEAVLWRARFFNFDAPGAQAACAAVRAAQEGCLVIPLTAADQEALATRD